MRKLTNNFILNTDILKKYEKAGLTTTELVVSLKLFSFNQMDVSLIELINEFGLEIKTQITPLITKELVTLKNEDGKFVANVEKLYEALTCDVLEAVEEKSADIIPDITEIKFAKQLTVNNVAQVKFILGREIKPIELESLKSWIESGFTFEMIEQAILKAGKKGIDSFNYIEAILKNSQTTESDSKVIDRGWSIWWKTTY
ncbi:MAG: DnaD domain protein [Mycoplasmatales bacterium]